MSATPAVFPVGTIDAHWITLDDDVMGGQSSTRVEVRERTLHFTGTTPGVATSTLASSPGRVRMYALSRFLGLH
ncbi:CIA30 family protein [Luteimonas sp. XNQY3]|nr:CIA30 family protein [Luteimonas sp. XNQY3]MCD9007058.1 CIA30 family protein [Luteimonas sp. XNQY3]